MLGTQNKDKIRELAHLLSGSKILVLGLSGFPGHPEVVENGKTFEANARKKARVYSRRTQGLTLADDSGLMVNCLNGRPGVYSARFAGTDCTYQDNNRKLLKLLKNISGRKRKAKFICVMSLYDKGKFVALVKGECSGMIALFEKGRGGFGYDPVFIPEGFTKTFAELSPATKNRISHRGKALRTMKRAILHYLNRK